MLQTFDFFEALFGTAANEMGIASEIWAFVSFIVVAGFFGSLFALCVNFIALIMNQTKREGDIINIVKTALMLFGFYILAQYWNIRLTPLLPYR